VEILGFCVLATVISAAETVQLCHLVDTRVDLGGSGPK